MADCFAFFRNLPLRGAEKPERPIPLQGQRFGVPGRHGGEFFRLFRKAGHQPVTGRFPTRAGALVGFAFDHAVTAQGCEGVVNRLGGGVAVEAPADFRAGQSGRAGLAEGLPQRFRRGAVEFLAPDVEREVLVIAPAFQGRAQVVDLDFSGAVEQGVGEGQPQHVDFRPAGDRPEATGSVSGETRVFRAPQFGCGGVASDAAKLPGAFDGPGHLVAHEGEIAVAEVATVGQEAGAFDQRPEELVREAVEEIVVREPVFEFFHRDVANDGNMRALTLSAFPPTHFNF